MAGQGQQYMTQEELNEALYWAYGLNNDQARAEELRGRGRPTCPCVRLERIAQGS